MLKYRMNSNGRRYISNPPRNKDRRIPTQYFKNVIIMYIFEREKYKPSEFKGYIDSLDIWIVKIGKKWLQETILNGNTILIELNNNC